jgi:hypothetical protein
VTAPPGASLTIVVGITRTYSVVRVSGSHPPLEDPDATVQSSRKGLHAERIAGRTEYAT